MIKNEAFSITTRYLSKRGKPTVPHLAAKIVQSIAIPAQGSKAFSLPIPSGSDGATIVVSYRLVNDEIRELLELKEPHLVEKNGD